MRTRNGIKVLSVIAICTALLVAAVPASAKKPQIREPDTYTVEMQFVDEQPGLSTGCAPEGPLVMTGTTRGSELKLSDTEAIAIHLRAPAVEWYRSYPNATPGTGFDECHGPSVYGGPNHPFSDYGGALWITIDYDAGTVDFLWHFDYYIDGEDRGKKKARWVGTVREHYTMSATAEYDATTGLVTGRFPVAWYLNEDGTLVHGYDLFEPLDGTEMAFYLEISPLD
jgi:hypothetical protein